MNIEKYILSKKTVLDSASQCQWKARLDTKMGFFNGIKEKPHELYQYFERRVRTEELKAWYSSPDPGDLFQGTSISSLVIPATFKRPLEIKGVEQLVEEIADCYIRYHDKYAKAVSDAIVESVEGWIKEGLFYGVVLPSKIISQAFDLAVDTRSLVVDIEGDAIDPHEITSYPAEIREKYFNSVRPGIECLSDMNISRQEFEASLILADVSKPKIQKYKGKALLGPIKCNEIAAYMAQDIKALIRSKTKGRISPRSFEVVIYDTDTPYTYHHVMEYNGDPDAPCLPGLTLLGASGSIDAFRWLYAYRVSLVAQKMMKGSLYSQYKASFTPFVFMGVLVPRDAEILIDMNDLDLLRYEGNISPRVEFGYLAEEMMNYIKRGK